MMMTKKMTNKIRQDVFVSRDELPGDIPECFTYDFNVHNIRTEALHVSSYTMGDTSKKNDNGLPEILESQTPRRISRKFITEKSKIHHDVAFPQDTAFTNDTDDFTWYQAPKNANKNDKEQLDKDVSNFLKNIGHINDDLRIREKTMTGANIVVERPQQKKKRTDMNSAFNNNRETKTQEHHSEHNNDAQTYEQVRSVLGENKKDWKNVIKTGKNTVKSHITTPSISETENNNNQSLLIENAMRQILQKENNNRVELEHMLTHKFSSDLQKMHNEMNKKINALNDAFNNFMMN